MNKGDVMAPRPLWGCGRSSEPLGKCGPWTSALCLLGEELWSIVLLSYPLLCHLEASINQHLWSRWPEVVCTHRRRHRGLESALWLQTGDASNVIFLSLKSGGAWINSQITRRWPSATRKPHSVSTPWERWPTKITESQQGCGAVCCSPAQELPPPDLTSCQYWISGPPSREVGTVRMLLDLEMKFKQLEKGHFSDRRSRWGARRFASNPISIFNYLYMTLSKCLYLHFSLLLCSTICHLLAPKRSESSKIPHVGTKPIGPLSKFIEYWTLSPDLS